jgi:hypothetical protein
VKSPSLSLTSIPCSIMKKPPLNDVPLRPCRNRYDEVHRYSPMLSPVRETMKRRKMRVHSAIQMASQMNRSTDGDGKAAGSSPPPRNLSPKEADLWRQVNNVGSVQHSVLVAGERPFKAGRPEFSSLVSGFLGEAPVWRTLHRTPLHTDYCGRPINYTEDVKSQLEDRARKVVNAKRRDAIERGESPDEGSPSSTQRRKEPPPKAAVAYDYLGRRVVIDSAHQPVPPPVHSIQKNYFRPNPWECGSPALTTYSKSIRG